VVMEPDRLKAEAAVDKWVARLLQGRRANVSVRNVDIRFGMFAGIHAAR
jgi:hypothetical protein